MLNLCFLCPLFPPVQKSKYRPLHLAAMSGSAQVVEQLLAKGAWVDARSQVRTRQCDSVEKNTDQSWVVGSCKNANGSMLDGLQLALQDALLLSGVR